MAVPCIMQGVADEPVLLHAHGSRLLSHGRGQEELRPHPRLSGSRHALLLGPGKYSVLFRYNAFFKKKYVRQNPAAASVLKQEHCTRVGEPNRPPPPGGQWQYLNTVQYSTVQYSTVYSTVQYSTVQCSTVQCSTIQYSIVQ